MAEDFTTYTEYDPNSLASIISSTQIDFDIGGTQASTLYIYKDYGANAFSGDFEIDFEFNANVPDAGFLQTNEGSIAVIGLSQGLGTLDDHDANLYKGLFCTLQLRKSWLGDFYYFALRETSTRTDSGNITIGTSYFGATLYGKFKRIGSSVSIEIYSDSARTNLIASTSISVSTIDAYQYIYALNNDDGLYLTNNNTAYGSVYNYNIISGLPSTPVIKEVGETLNFEEFIVYRRGKIREANETEEVGEGPLRFITFKRLLRETLELTENIYPLRALRRTLGETLDLQEGISYLKALLRSIGESLSLSEESLFRRRFIRPISEGINLTETITSKISTFIKQVIGETLNLSEGLLSKKSLLQAVNEALNLNEGLLRRLSLRRPINEGLNISEGLTKRLSLRRLIGEALNLMEEVRPPRGLRRTLGETLDLTEQALRMRLLFKVINEALNISEQALSRLVKYIRRFILSILKKELKAEVKTQFLRGEIKGLY